MLKYIRRWIIYSGFFFWVFHLFGPSFNPLYILVFLGLLCSTILGAILAAIFDKDISLFSFLGKIYLVALTTLPLTYFLEFKIKDLDVLHVGLILVLCSFVIFAYLLTHFLNWKKSLKIGLFISLLTILVILMLLNLRNYRLEHNHLVSLEWILLLSLSWQLAAYLYKKKRILLIPFLGLLIPIFGLFFTSFQLVGNQERTNHETVNDIDTNLPDQPILNIEQKEPEIISPVQIDPDSLAASIEEYNNVYPTFYVSADIFNLFSPDYLFNTSINSERLMRLNDIALIIDRDGDKLMRFYKTNRDILFGAFSFKMYHSSNINYYIDLLVTTYQNLTSNVHYNKFMPELCDSLYNINKSSFANEIFVNVFSKYNSTIEFTKYEEIWAYTFWCRRFREQNIEEVYYIVQDIQQYYWKQESLMQEGISEGNSE